MIVLLPFLIKLLLCESVGRLVLVRKVTAGQDLLKFPLEDQVGQVRTGIRCLQLPPELSFIKIDTVQERLKEGRLFPLHPVDVGNDLLPQLLVRVKGIAGKSDRDVVPVEIANQLLRCLSNQSKVSTVAFRQFSHRKVCPSKNR